MPALEFIDNDIYYIVGSNEGVSTAVKLYVWSEIIVSTKTALSKTHTHSVIFTLQCVWGFSLFRIKVTVSSFKDGSPSFHISNTHTYYSLYWLYP